MLKAFARRAAIVIVVALGAALPNIAVAQDGLVGTWNFVPDRSKSTGGPLRYKNMTLTIPAPDQMNFEGVDAAGKPVKSNFNSVLDNKPHPVTGMADYDSSSWNSYSATATGYIYMKRKANVVIGTRSISRDGNTLTFNEKQFDSRGKETGSQTLVFAKPGFEHVSAPAVTAAVPAGTVMTVSALNADEQAGTAALEKDDVDGAIAAFSKAIDTKAPNAVYDRLSRGIAYAKKNMNDEALGDFKAAIAIKPDDADAHFRMGGALIQMKQYKEAIAAFSDAIKYDAMNAMAYRLRGFAYNTLGQDRDAAGDYDKACELNKELCQK